MKFQSDPIIKLRDKISTVKLDNIFSFKKQNKTIFGQNGTGIF